MKPSPSSFHPWLSTWPYLEPSTSRPARHGPPRGLPLHSAVSGRDPHVRNDDDEDQHGAMLWLGFRKAEVKELELRERKYEEHSLCPLCAHEMRNHSSNAQRRTRATCEGPVHLLYILTLFTSSFQLSKYSSAIVSQSFYSVALCCSHNPSRLYPGPILIEISS